jgi:hypothetical protein
MISPERAQEILVKDRAEQENFYTVIVDGNRHQLGQRIVTKKEAITVAKCQDMVKSLEQKFGITVSKIDILMTEWDYDSIIDGNEYLYVLSGDVPLRMKVHKTAYYWPKINRLQIWEDGSPVYENDNGRICRDIDALADCLM